VIHVRVGGHGPAVVLLHGYGETGDMWVPLTATGWWRSSPPPRSQLFALFWTSRS